MDFSKHDKLTKEGFLRKVVSPCGNLVLYNYTDKCTYEKKWNKHTLNARGTVYEISTGKTIAKAFPKFFNFGELPVSQSRNLLNKTDFEVFEKMDGSLGIVYFYDGEWRVNTRGSFTSDQAIKATEMLKKYNLTNIDKNITIMVEIIYPENRIIVDYGKEEKLVVLGAYYSTGDEILLNDLNLIDMPKVDSYYFKKIADIIDLQSKLGIMEEGFVVRFKDGYRCKFKSFEYLKVARILSEMTPLVFWKNMVDGVVPVELIQSIPEEFREEAEIIKNGLEKHYKSIYKQIEMDFLEVELAAYITNDTIEIARKKVGIFLKYHGKHLKHKEAIFPKLLNKDIDKYIMKYIRPVNNKIMVL